MSSTGESLNRLARQVASRLRETARTLVLAESCTGGLVSSYLTKIPGISEFHAGSMVVYQLPSKSAWLGVDPAILIDPGAVSAPVAEAMAVGALNQTPHANLAASITGHLGPAAPPSLDGLLFVGIAQRAGDGTISCQVKKIQLPRGDEIFGISPTRLRIIRQRLATAEVFRQILDGIEFEKV